MESHHEKIVEMFVEHMTLSDCEKRIVYTKYDGLMYVSLKKVCGTIACVFELSTEFVADLANLGKVRNIPLKNQDFIPNYC